MTAQMEDPNGLFSGIFYFLQANAGGMP